jgi:hypothetical protein
MLSYWSVQALVLGQYLNIVTCRASKYWSPGTPFQPLTAPRISVRMSLLHAYILLRTSIFRLYSMMYISFNKTRASVRSSSPFSHDHSVRQRLDLWIKEGEAWDFSPPVFLWTRSNWSFDMRITGNFICESSYLQRYSTVRKLNSILCLICNE